jgi:L-asparaginase
MSYKILLITTGGTIAQTHDEDGTAVSSEDNGFQATCDDIKISLKKNPEETYEIEEIVPLPIMNKDSSNIVPDDWVSMIRAVEENYDSYDAFVITHGTNTLGYTCSALSFALGNLGKPVVLTGSQVSFGYPSSDAMMNLESAFRIAAYKQAKIVGVMAVFGSNIITGTRVKKTTEFDFDAFKVFGTAKSIGRIGNSIRIDNTALEWHLGFQKVRAKCRKELDIKNRFVPNIVSLTEFPGLNAAVFKALVENEKTAAKGFVLRATGAGDPNIAEKGANFKDLREGFEYLRDTEIPIVVTTQAPDGVASMHINGPGKLALDLNAIPAWDMSMESMTVKLAWLLGQEMSYNQIRNQMAISLKGEINILTPIKEKNQYDSE